MYPVYDFSFVYFVRACVFYVFLISFFLVYSCVCFEHDFYNNNNNTNNNNIRSNLKLLCYAVWDEITSITGTFV